MNEQIQALNSQAQAANEGADPPLGSQPREIRADSRLAPQAGEADCGCGTTPDPDRKNAPPVSYVYAIGRVEARFPNLAAEKEFAQAGGERILPGKPTSRPSTRFCQDARTAT